MKTIKILANYMLSQDERGFWHMSKLISPDEGVEMICQEVEIFDLFKEIHEQHLLNHHEYFSQKRMEEEEDLCDEKGRPL
tara:strand:- start:1393 stop:1632 length:240 start_codon:yes stop_codon:yes gene_type:complete